MLKIQDLRKLAISQSLSKPGSLKAGIDRLGFVQADPIKAPAAAQDLILRQRVKSCKVGDWERLYTTLEIEEDLLYAYGFLPRNVWSLMHPRNRTGLSTLEKNVLAIVRDLGQIHPRELEAHFGGERVLNAWGGFSKASKQALEALHYRGLLRIARREKGIKVYEPAAESPDERMKIDARARKLVLVVTRLFQPILLRSLKEILTRVRHSLEGPFNTDIALAELFKSGELRQDIIDGLAYVCSADLGNLPEDTTRQVRFLAPFDPIVWDRRRFEHLWQWSYRFEAYTPSAKRERGYYALPLLWGDSIIGWVNASVVNDCLVVEPGFIEKRPRGSDFKVAFEDEIARLEKFLKLQHR